MLVVSAKKRSGPFHSANMNKANELAKSGIRVGQCYISGSNTWHCHICNKDNSIIPSFNENGVDEMGECEHCKAPFLFISYAGAPSLTRR